MSADSSSRIGTGSLPVILLAAVVQGASLLWLHLAADNQRWPATKPAWLLGFYAIAVFVPLTAQLIAAHLRERYAWYVLAALAGAFFYFGWYHGSNLVVEEPRRVLQLWQAMPGAFVLALLWLLTVPFIQARLIEGRWRARYEVLFSTAWNNKLVLAEAALFTGLFWLLLLLWQELFGMLGIPFFKELFDEPTFVYPVTSLTFGIALHLIGSLERLTQTILEQLLNVLKWLALLAGFILALFTVALVLKLPGMIASGERAIGAAWLLWLLAVTVLLLNAAYRDGSTERPYPALIAKSLRYVTPLTLIIALTAIYALYLRIDRYGLTVSRVWACVVAGALVLYSIGYSLTSLRSARWMAGIAAVNVRVALLLIVVLASAFTPILSPYRLSAASQFRIAQRLDVAPDDSVFQYLRYELGRYGTAKLTELTQLVDHPRAQQLQAAAKRALEQPSRGVPGKPPSGAQLAARFVIFPAGREVDGVLLRQLENDIASPAVAWMFAGTDRIGAVFIDLDGDSVEEFVLVADARAVGYRRMSDRWHSIGHLAPSGASRQGVAGEAVANGAVTAESAKWKDLKVGDRLYRFVGQQ